MPGTAQLKGDVLQVELCSLPAGKLYQHAPTETSQATLASVSPVFAVVSTCRHFRQRGQLVQDDGAFSLLFVWFLILRRHKNRWICVSENVPSSKLLV